MFYIFYICSFMSISSKFKIYSKMLTKTNISKHKDVSVSYSFSSFTKPIITFRLKIYQSFWILLKKPRLRDFVATPRGNESPVTEAGGGRRRRRVVRYDSSRFGSFIVNDIRIGSGN
ncbi:hypothetical protein Hanom_Chr15g01362521 [Helianthus anomalus]